MNITYKLLPALLFTSGISVTAWTMDTNENLYSVNSGEIISSSRLSLSMAEKTADEDQRNLGQMYTDRAEYAPNDVEAEKWLRRAAEQGYAEGQYKLAILYLKWNGEKTSEESINLFRSAADQGHEASLAILNLIYSKGSGVTRDIEEIKRFPKRPAEQGNDELEKKFTKI